MRTNMLELLAEGNLDARAASFDKGSRYAKALHEVVLTKDLVLKLLDHEGKARFDAFCNASGEEETLFGISRFITGYRLGTLLMAEVFLSEDAIMYGSASSE